jgi:hypothetical protein
MMWINRESVKVDRVACCRRWTILFVALVAACPLLAPVAAPSRTFGPGPDLFGPVWDVMNRMPNKMGCVGCHIADRPAFGPWFGYDQDSVYTTLVTGVDPDGNVIFDPPPVDGGRSGTLGIFLHEGYMPLGGQRWGEKELALLDEWLITFEP